MRHVYLAALAWLVTLTAAGQDPPLNGLLVDCDARHGHAASMADGVEIAEWDSEVGPWSFTWPTPAQRPTWDAKRQAIVFNEGADQRLGMAVAGSSNEFSYAVIAAVTPLRRGVAAYGQWQGTAESQPLITAGSSSLAYTPSQPRFTVGDQTTGFLPTSSYSLFGVAGGTMFHNDARFSFEAQADEFSHLYLGGPDQYTGATHMLVKRVLAWDRVLTDGELSDLYAYAQNQYGLADLSQPAVRIVMLGDSIGTGGVADSQRGVLALATDPFTKAAVYNYAEASQQFSDMHVTFGATIAPCLLQGDAPNVVLIEGGTNDLHSASAAVSFARLQTLCQDVRAADPDATIIVSTVTPRVTPGDQPRIDQYNALVRANYATMADHLWDAAAVPGMGNPFDFSLYKDGLHPSTIGHELLAQSLRPLLRSLLPDAVSDSFDPADFNLDGLVDFADMQAIKTHFGVGAFDGSAVLLWQQRNSQEPTLDAIPEPATAALLLVALVGLRRRRHPHRLHQRLYCDSVFPGAAGDLCSVAQFACGG